jgi:hypothetical protein
MSIRKLAAFALGLMASAGAVSASSLGLVPTYPDTTVAFASAQYSAQSDLLHVEGIPGTLTPDGINITDEFLGEFTLDARINGSGQLVPDAINTFTIYQILDNGGEVLKLSGTLTSFGFTNVPPAPPGQTSTTVYEFTFTPTGGAYLPLYGNTGGMIFKFAASGETGIHFGDDFRLADPAASNGDVFALAAAVPVPAALPAGLFLLGATVAVRIRRRRMAR